MTFIGKILVIVVMVFSLIFLGISTVSLSTAKNWAVRIEKEQTAVKEFQKKLTDAKVQADLVKKALDDLPGAACPGEEGPGDSDRGTSGGNQA